MGATVDEIWKRLEEWAAANAKPVARSLGKGVTDKAVAKAEAALGQPLPKDYLASLARHNGQKRGDFGSPGFVFGESLFPIATSLETWRMLAEILDEDDERPRKVLTDGPVRAVWWDKLWWPITDDGNNNLTCLDLHPAPRGRVGQVIQYWNDNLLRSVIAKSYADWLAEFADDLDKGEYVYAEEYGGLMLTQDALAEGLIEEPPAAFRPYKGKGKG
jgi:cell wall assembly regulator SMI1